MRPRRKTIPGSRTKPITIIVPWAAGGSTDQVIRVTAAEIEKALDQKVVVVNQPGASGSIGTKNALEAPKDGYTWTSGAAKDIGTYVVSGLLDTKVADWRLYLAVINVSVLGVNPALALQERAGSRRCDESEAGPGLGGHRGHQFVRSCRDRGLQPRARCHLQARDL